MMWFAASAWSAPPAAELLLRCRQEDEQWWTCGDVVLQDGARFAKGPLRARLTAGEGVVVELFDHGVGRPHHVGRGRRGAAPRVRVGGRPRRDVGELQRRQPPRGRRR